ncbi:MAG TPA: sugar ABC transporter permease [Chloroflexota bacterium]|jgi:multiple sugar transport system permease protein|nr:sugar ABC transporter permease [Chloroflexota bacterium]
MAVRDATVARIAPGRRPIEDALGKDWRLAYPLLLPVLLVIVGLVAYPFATSIWYSVQDVKIGGEGRFIGLTNYATLLWGIESERFWNSLQVSVFYTGVVLLAKFVLGMTMALILHHAIVARDLWRALVFVPWAIPGVVSAYTWKWMYDDMRGVLNLNLMAWKIVDFPIQWLADYNLALWSVLVAVTWSGTPFWIMTFLAGMQSIPTDMYDAAHIDGAGAFRSFLHITLPNLTPVIIVTFMLSAIWTANGVQYVYILTNGGPARATETFPLLALTLGIRSYNLGMGATVPLIFFPLFAAIIWFLSRRMLQSEAAR